MTDHQIRLRGAWDRLDDLNAPARRVDLPTVWSVADSARPFRLVRKFGRPPFDPNTQAIRLELVDVPGLLAVRLNGRTLPVKDNPTRIELGGELSSRNLLELDVDLSGREKRDEGSPWGTIALVIAARSG